MSRHSSRMDEYMVGEPYLRSGLGLDNESKELMIAKIAAEAARREAALRKKIGEPKFKVGDRVWFKADGDIAYNNENLFARFKRPVATVDIVDATGTFEQHDEPSYDLWLEQTDGSKLMWKHIRQSELEAVTGADDDGDDGQA